MKNFSDDAFTKFIAISSKVSFAPGDILLKEGELSDDLFVLVSGQVRLDKQCKATSKSENIGTLRAGATLGEMRVIQNSECSLTATASENTVALRMSIQQLRSDSFFYEKTLESVIRIISTRLYSSNELVANDITDKKKRKKQLFFSILCILTLVLFLCESGFVLYYTLHSSEYFCNKINNHPAQFPNISSTSDTSSRGACDEGSPNCGTMHFAGDPSLCSR